MGVDTQFWSDLVNLDRHVDGLVEKVRRAVRPSQPITREIPYFASVEVLFQNLPINLAATPSANSDALAGNNVKHVQIQNRAARVYIREFNIDSWFVNPTSTPPNARSPNNLDGFSFNYRWNFRTSITDRRYSDRRCLASAAGRKSSGVHLRFKDPLVIEPMESFEFECELLSYLAFIGVTSAIVQATISGYREGF